MVPISPSPLAPGSTRRGPPGRTRRIDGLAVTEYRPPTERPGGPVADLPLVVLVHGSLDRGDSFRRVVRRLGDRRVVTYDRRGYGASAHRDDRPLDLAAHAADLVGLVDALASGSPPVAVGHSFGGAVVMTAAARYPGTFGAIAVYEPPLPWFGFRRAGATAPPPDHPDREVESFFRRMVGDDAWGRLSEQGRASRLADGPALVADMTALHGTDAAPFEVAALRAPAVFGCGGPASTDRHRRTTAWLAGQIPGAVAVEIPGAGHGAHLSHPDAFAEMVRRATSERRSPGDPAAPTGGRP